MNINSPPVESADHGESNQLDQRPESPVRTSRDEKRSPSLQTIDNLEDLSEVQVLRRIVRAIECDSEQIAGLLREMAHLRHRETNAVLPRPTQLGLHPRSRVLGPGPGLIDRTPEQKLE